ICTTRRDQSSGSAIFRGHEWSETVQPFVGTQDTLGCGIGVEEPVFTMFRSRPPKHAPRSRQIKILRETVADHRDVRQSTNQFGPADSAALVPEIIVVKRRGRTRYPLE